MHEITLEPPVTEPHKKEKVKNQVEPSFYMMRKTRKIPTLVSMSENEILVALLNVELRIRAKLADADFMGGNSLAEWLISSCSSKRKF